MTVTINGTTGVSGVAGSASTPALIGSDADSGYYINSANEPNASVNGTAVWSAASTFGFKNRIINPGMVIDQRNAGASVTVSGDMYTLDRWYATQSVASKFSVQQNAGSVTPPAGYTKYLGCTSLSAYSVGASDSFSVRQMIEGFNVADLAWGTASAASVTLSFWVRSSLTGTFGGVLKNSGNDRIYPFTYTINSANTWEQKSVTIAGDQSGTWVTDSGIGIRLVFSIGAGSTVSGTAGSWGSTNYNSATGATSVVGTNGATFYITGVQLEKGSTATSFDFRSFGTELQLCQRYYETSYNYGVAVGSNNSNGRIILSGSSQAANLCLLSIPYKVSKRTNATATLYSQTGTASTWDYERSGVTSTNTPVVYEGGTQGTNVYINVGASWVSCTTYGHFAVSAEL